MRRAGGRQGSGRRRWAAGSAWSGGGPLVRRWIGAHRRRAARTRPGADGAGAEIVTLTWAQTFGRDAGPARPDRRQGATADEAAPRIVDLGDGRPAS